MLHYGFNEDIDITYMVWLIGSIKKIFDSQRNRKFMWKCRFELNPGW